MAASEEDTSWVCTQEMQLNLITLYENNRDQWDKEMATMLLEHPSKFKILTVGTDDDKECTFDEFASHFIGTPGAIHDKQLLAMIYADVEFAVGGDGKVKLNDIHLWMNKIREQLQPPSDPEPEPEPEADAEPEQQQEPEPAPEPEAPAVIHHDQTWLLEQLANITVPDLDTDLSGAVSRVEFRSHLVDTHGIDVEIADAIFDDIDHNDDGQLSIAEYTKWKSTLSTLPPPAQPVDAAPLSPMVSVQASSPRALGHIPESTSASAETVQYRSERTEAFDSMASASSMTSASTMDSENFQIAILRERLAEANHRHDQMALLYADLVAEHNHLLDDHEKLKAEDPDWRVSPELQQALIELYAKNPHQWRVDIVTMVQAHPSRFNILDAAKTEDIASDYLYPFNEFASHFRNKEGSIHNEELLRLMFDDMQKYDDKHVKLETISQWMNTIPQNDKAKRVNEDAKDGNEDQERDRKMNVLKLRIEVLELEKADLDFKLKEKTKELDNVMESTMARYEEMERKYKALLQELDEDDDALNERGNDRARNRRRRGKRMKEQLKDEESGTCSMWPTFKDY